MRNIQIVTNTKTAENFMRSAMAPMIKAGGMPRIVVGLDGAGMWARAGLRWRHWLAGAWNLGQARSYIETGTVPLEGVDRDESEDSVSLRRVPLSLGRGLRAFRRRRCTRLRRYRPAHGRQ
jgi:hypothetical protein